MDLESMTIAQLRGLIQHAQARIEQIVQDAQQSEQDNLAAIGAAVAALDALIGDGAPKGTGSIVAVRQYTGAEMVTHAAVALPLVFEGLEILARATRDLARAVGTRGA